MKCIEEVYSENEQYQCLVRCQFIEIDKKKEAELILSLDITKETARATATPNLGHEIFMFQKFGLANKHSIMERLAAEQRLWMEIELKLEARHNQGISPWYSTPCILISQLVWKTESIDNFDWHYIETWFQRVGSCYEKKYHLKGEALEYVARLILADFPMSMLVFGVQDSYATDDVEGDIPVWNQFSTRLVRVMDIADVRLANEGFLVTLSLVQHLGKIKIHARIFGLHLHRSWTLMCDKGYLHRDTREQVLDLTIGLFYRKISIGVVS
ncbi:hypothetical protein L7F22_053853 [Adiantum nelumboides]|nr:hypothetical protein [Adiantum nelumboides]